MQSLRSALGGVIVLVSVGVTARAQESMQADVVARVKEATTYIRTTAGDGTSISGSGFLIRVDGTTGYVVTNHHVIAAPTEKAGESSRATTRVYFHSGMKSEVAVPGEVMATAPARDLALLRVRDVPQLPRPIELSTDLEPFETMVVFIFGFPFGERLALGRENPPVNVGRGQVSSIRRDESDRLTAILLDGALNPGNSGGPVVDARGRLIGVAEATIRGANIGFAIAVPEVLSVLDGRAEQPAIAIGPGAGGTVELTVGVPLVDPLGRIKSARLLHACGSASFTRKKRPAPSRTPIVVEDREDEPGDNAIAPRANPASDSPFEYGPIEGAESLPLRVDGLRATGSLKIAVTGADLVFWTQVALVDGSGRTVHTRPIRHLLGGPKPAGNDGTAQGLTIWGEVLDPDDDCALKLAEGALEFAVPGTLHDLNIDIDRTNAPRVVQEIEGDFVAVVKVAGSFDPGPVRTGPRSVPYNGGGLLAWSDEGNYIRLERGAMYRSSRVVGFVAFESREQGTRAAVHNKGGLDPGKDLWLRLQRRGGVISGSWSLDGRDWNELEPMEVAWPLRLKVGVAAVNSCGDAMTVRFQSYALTMQTPPRGS